MLQVFVAIQKILYFADDDGTTMAEAQAMISVHRWRMCTWISNI